MPASPTDAAAPPPVDTDRLAALTDEQCNRMLRLTTLSMANMRRAGNEGRPAIIEASARSRHRDDEPGRDGVSGGRSMSSVRSDRGFGALMP
jgi:hypothetical protein